MAPSRGLGLTTTAANFRSQFSRPQLHIQLNPQSLPWRRRQQQQQQLRQQLSLTIRQPGCRSFSSSAPVSAPSAVQLLDITTEHVHSGFAFLHYTVGLPWYVTLPLAAVIVRTTVATPLLLLSRSSLQQEATLTPKIIEARPELEQKVLEKYGHKGPEYATMMLSFELRKKRKEMVNEAGIRTWPRWAPLAQIPVWLMVMDTLRRMCGQSGGVFTSFIGRDDIASIAGVATDATESGGELGAGVGAGAVSGLTSAGGISGAAPASLPTSSAQSELSSSVLPLTRQDTPSFEVLNKTTTPQSSTDLSLSSLDIDTSTFQDVLEPSLSSGGILWFPDLMSADPKLILPFCLSAVLFTNIRRNELQMEAAGIRPTRLSRITTNMLKILALALGPLTLNFPSGMLLYWLGSSSSSIFQNSFIDWLRPIDRQAIKEAKERDRQRIEAQARARGAGTNSQQGESTGPAKKLYRPKRSRK